MILHGYIEEVITLVDAWYVIIVIGPYETMAMRITFDVVGVKDETSIDMVRLRRSFVVNVANITAEFVEKEKAQ